APPRSCVPLRAGELGGCPAMLDRRRLGAVIARRRPVADLRPVGCAAPRCAADRSARPLRRSPPVGQRGRPAPAHRRRRESAAVLQVPREPPPRPRPPPAIAEVWPPAL